MNECCDVCLLNHKTAEHANFKPLKVKAFQPFVPTELEKAQIIELWHISRCESYRLHERLKYVEKWFRRAFPKVNCSSKALRLAIESLLDL